MSQIRIRRGWEIPEREAVSEEVYLNRREFVKKLGLAGIGAAGMLVGGSKAALAGTDRALAFLSEPNPQTSRGLYPARRNPKYVLDRPLTEEKYSTRYNNFYEFTTDKPRVVDLVGNFKTRPWTVEVTGMVSKPKTFDIDELLRLFPLEERLYRHRCVEAWAMAVPWTGFPLKALVDHVQPTSKAKFVRMISFNKPDEAPGMKTQLWYPWPYYEGLTLAEATNELAFMVTGIYGHALPKQNGAPLRLAVPWKYGYKSIKSIVKIEFTDQQPKTFWNDIAPNEYSFLSNVNPKVPHPRWSQAYERMIIDGERRPTLPYNGYGEFVAHLYA
jgi:sulfoxide reductase catalytic subunit YedY